MERAKTRKPHKKSRNGCLPCKGRHVKVTHQSFTNIRLPHWGNKPANTILPKCDEQKPNCANCVKQGTVCEYRPLNSRDGSIANTSPLAAGSTPTFTPSVVGTPMSSGDGMVLEHTISDFNAVQMNGVPLIGPDLTLNIAQMRLLQYVFPLFRSIS
jgi:hypothetical protein